MEEVPKEADPEKERPQTTENPKNNDEPNFWPILESHILCITADSMPNQNGKEVKIKGRQWKEYENGGRSSKSCDDCL